MEDKNEIMRDKFRGTLLGLAVGDALGAPVEFMTPRTIMQKLGIIGPLKDMVGGGWLNLKPGEYTDDTDMMLCIAESLAENEVYNPDDIARRFVDWYRSDPKDIGGTTRGALARIGNGIPWQRAGDPDSPANGSVMRCAPIGLFFAFDESKLMQASIETSSITHASVEATMSCFLINLMIAKLVKGEDKQKAFEHSLETVREEATYVEIFFDSERVPIDISRGLASVAVRLATSGLLSAFSLEESIVRVVNLGGDADTNGAVTGALAGAYWGASAIPEIWSSLLNPCSAQQIMDLADKIFNLAIARK